MESPRVLIAGAGITGLAAGHRLAAAGVQVTLIEAAPRPGGKIATEQADGFLVEAGPDSFITTRPAALDLCRELGLQDRLVGPGRTRTVYVWYRGRLIPMPEGLGLVLPTRLGPLARTRLFSPLDKLRILLDLLLPRGAQDSDESVGHLLRRRVGNALTDRLAGPLLGGIYGTPVDQLSLLAVAPQLREAEVRHRSLLLSALEQRRRQGRPETCSTPMFLSLAGGMGDLVTALTARLGRTELRTSVSLRALERRGGNYIAHCSDGSSLEAQGVILTTPAPVTAELVAPLAPGAAEALRRIPYGSSAAISLGYPESAVPRRLDGHGFVVASGQGLAISACSWSSAKWPGRAPAACVLLRAFIGDASGGMSEAELVATARTDLERTMGIRQPPLMTRVARWKDAMPRYTVGHLARVDTILSTVSELPAFAVAGATYRGSGLPDCIVQGRQAALAVAGALESRTDRDS